MSNHKKIDKTERIRGRRLQSIRASFLLDNPLCVTCKANGKITMAVEVDHIVPLYKGGAECNANRQSLCKQCHKEKTEIDIGARLTSGSDISGMPTRPSHHWNL